MIRIILLLFVLIHAVIAYPQKRVIDAAACDSWPNISDEMISNNGRYVAYYVGSKAAGLVLTVQAAETDWKKEMPNVSNSAFSEDSRYLTFSTSSDSIGILTLGTQDIKWITGISGFKTPKSGSGRWMAYQANSAEKELVIYDLNSGKSIRQKYVLDYFFTEEGNSLVAVSGLQSDIGKTKKVFWFNLRKGSIDSLSIEGRPFNFSFDKSGSQLAFLCEHMEVGGPTTKLWHYKRGMHKPDMLVARSTKAMAGLKLSSTKLFFSKSGKQVLFYVEKDNGKKRTPLQGVANVDIWNYQDIELQSQQLKSIHIIPRFVAVVSLVSGEGMIRLQQEFDSYIREPLGESEPYILAISSSGNNKDSESSTAASITQSHVLINTVNGTRKPLNVHFSDYSQFSGGGKYVIAFDKVVGNWFCYDINKDTTVNISAKIPVPLTFFSDYPDYANPEGIVGWMEDDRSVLIYDRFDIWQVDPTGRRSPINITQGIGRKSGIRLRFVNMNGGKSLVFKSTERLILEGFNIKSKDNGFFALSLGKTPLLERLTMGPFTYFFYYRSLSPSLSGISRQVIPKRAKDANRFLLRQMTSTHYPNLVTTENFKDFKQLTDLAPEKGYHWLTSELLTWTLDDGTLMEGIVYKPENMDTTKKYPVVFYYYDNLSDALNMYLHPALSNGVLNIPWFVSNGYVVCAPDIHYKIGLPGESAFTSVVSAAKYLQKKGYVDPQRMGLQGHSFGGYHTNYILTRTNIFAAAAASSGVSDVISSYGGIVSNGESKHNYYEKRQGRIGATMWEQSDLYIRSSPIFNADKVTTPLLLMHTTNDTRVPLAQSVEWFTALQSLGKRVWLLQYYGDDHTLDNELNMRDYSIRLSQFFDHYLKGIPKPVWMRKGVSAKEKGFETGLDVD